MEFEVAFTNVLLTLMYIVPGYLVCRAKRATADHLPTLSAILIYVCSPCMLVSSLISLEFSVEGIRNLGLFFAVSLLLQGAFMLLLFFLLRRRMGEKRYRILTMASVMGNVGFFGLPLVKVLLPDNPEVLTYSAAYIVSMNVLLFTVGVFCLTGKKQYMSLKAAVWNPTVIGFFIGLPLYIFGVGEHLPDVVKNGVGLLGNMTTPLCMLILGIRLATIPLKRLFARPFVYGILAAKLILYPLFTLGAVCLLPVPYSFKASIVILSATPCASAVQSLAEIYRSETELSANCVMLSTLLCFLTLPVMTLLL